MRSSYTDEEVRALVEIKNMLSAEIARMTALTVAYFGHLVDCGTADHRREVASRASKSVTALLQHLRYCAWIEAELTKNRVFENPQAILDEFAAQQTEIAEAAREKLEPEPQPELLAENTVVGEDPAAAMDKLATAPGTRTKQ
jgi:hypothetical protein